MQRERIGEGYLEPETRFQAAVSKILRWPSREPDARRVLLEAREREVMVF